MNARILLLLLLISFAACRAQNPLARLSHTVTDTAQKWEGDCHNSFRSTCIPIANKSNDTLFKAKDDQGKWNIADNADKLYGLLPPHTDGKLWLNYPDSAKSGTDVITLHFRWKRKALHHTIARTATVLLPELIRFASPPIFDLGRVVTNNSEFTRTWRIQNVSGVALIAPAVVDVWNDCGIDNGHTRMEPLAPGKWRDVVFRIHFPPKEGPRTREGCICIKGWMHGRDAEQCIFAHVTGVIVLDTAAHR